MGKELSNFYALEGLDGVGKSTIVNGLKENGLRVLRTPPDTMRWLRPLFEHADLRARFVYYLSGVLYAGMQASRNDPNQRVISDRFLLTTVAAHEAMGLNSNFIGFFMPLIKFAPIPKSTFLLVCEENERLRRMHQRGANIIDLKNIGINQKLLEGYSKWSEVLGHKIVEVDTTNITPGQVIQEVMEKVNV